MPKGISDTFADGLARLLSEVGKLRAYPDADDDLLNGVQDMLVQHVRAAAAPQAPQAPMAGGLLSALGGEGLPVTEAGLSRGPVPGLDMREATQALEREMAGQRAPGASVTS